MTNQIDAFKLSKDILREETVVLNPLDIPKHIAIIMDGNRRWASKKGFSPSAGYWAGAENLTKIVKSASDIGVKTLTVYAFSTENWLRPSQEIAALMELFRIFLVKQCLPMQKDGVRLTTIGDLSKLPDDLQRIIEQTKDKTAHCEKIELVLAVNYGARNEITRAVSKILEDFESGTILKEDVSENLVSRYLDTSRNRDPDLLIRTSGEMRLSNFLLWQISYSEVVILETLWPDFTKEDLYQAIVDYQQRDRRLGKL